jgi:hypothetical protein
VVYSGTGSFSSPSSGSVTARGARHVLEVQCGRKSHAFVAQSEQELADWFEAIEDALVGVLTGGERERESVVTIMLRFSTTKKKKKKTHVLVLAVFLCTCAFMYLSVYACVYACVYVYM